MFRLPAATKGATVELKKALDGKQGAYQLLHFMYSGMSGLALDGLRHLLVEDADPEVAAFIYDRLAKLLRGALGELRVCPLCDNPKLIEATACNECEQLARSWLELREGPPDDIKHLAKLIQEDDK